MTARHTYTCNLCHSSITDADASNLGKRGVGIYHGVIARSITFKLLSDANNHICEDCIDGIIGERNRLGGRP